jgi:hypothetical protein
MKRALLFPALILLSGAIAVPAQERASDDIFSSPTVFEATIEAPFRDLIQRGRTDQKFVVDGTLSFMTPEGRRVVMEGVEVSLRGHTSLRETECEFPKLKLKLPENRPPFLRDIETLKIGTHCGQKADGELTPKYGRWANEKAPHREAAVYRLLEAVGVPTLRARAARLSYVFTDRGEQPPVVRNAMLLEDDDRLLKRIGGTAFVGEKQFSSAREAFTPRDALRIAFAQAMIGNFDWCLRYTPDDNYRCNQRHPLWNVLALRTPKGLVPAIYDFDLSGLVTGRHLWFRNVFNLDFSAAKSAPQVEVLSQVQRPRRLFTRAELDAGRAEFMRVKNAAFASIAESPIDEGWRPRMEEYLNSFFDAIESDDAFYRPVVVDPEARFFTDASSRTPACGEDKAPVGTVVSEPLELSGSMMRVMVLDAHWQWAPPRKCEVIHREPVWIAAGAISEDFPK